MKNQIIFDAVMLSILKQMEKDGYMKLSENINRSNYKEPGLISFIVDPNECAKVLDNMFYQYFKIGNKIKMADIGLSKEELENATN